VILNPQVLSGYYTTPSLKLPDSNLKSGAIIDRFSSFVNRMKTIGRVYDESDGNSPIRCRKRAQVKCVMRPNSMNYSHMSILVSSQLHPLTWAISIIAYQHIDGRYRFEKQTLRLNVVNSPKYSILTAPDMVSIKWARFLKGSSQFTSPGRINDAEA
jgi:hypothetical protein